MENETIFFLAKKGNKVITGYRGQVAFTNLKSLKLSLAQRDDYRKDIKDQYEVVEFTLNDILRGKSEFWRD